MVHFLRKIFWPILSIFEKGSEEFAHKPMNRKILITLGLLFFLLAAVIAWVVVRNEQWGGVLPVIVFAGVGIVSLVVGTLGSDRAVAKIWGSQ